MPSQTVTQTFNANTSGAGWSQHDYLYAIPGAASAPYFRVSCTYTNIGDALPGKTLGFLALANKPGVGLQEIHKAPGVFTRYSYKNGATDSVKSYVNDLLGLDATEYNWKSMQMEDWTTMDGYGYSGLVQAVITAKWGETPEDVADCTPWAKSVKVTLFADVNGTRQASKKTCALSSNGETQVNFDSSDFGGGDYSLLGVRVYNDTNARLPDGFGYRVNLKVTKQMTPVNFFEDMFTGLYTGDWGEEDIGIGNTPHDNLGFKDLGGRNSNNVSNEFFPRYLREVQVILNKVSYSEEPECPLPVTPDKPDEEFEEEHQGWFPEPVEPVQPVEPVEPVQPVEPVEPVQPVEPVEPVEPVQPIVIIKGAEDECCEKTIAVLNELNSTIYNSSLALTSSLERIVEKLDTKNKQDIFIANALNEQNRIIADSTNGILSKMFLVMLYNAFMKSAEVVDNAIDMTGQFDKLITAIEQALISTKSDGLKVGLADIIELKELMQDNIINVDYPNEVVMDSFDRKVK